MVLDVEYRVLFCTNFEAKILINTFCMSQSQFILFTRIIQFKTVTRLIVDGFSRFICCPVQRFTLNAHLKNHGSCGSQF